MAYRRVGAVRIPPGRIPRPSRWKRRGWGRGWGAVFDRDRLARRYRRLVPGRWKLAMIVALRPGGYIPFHTDDVAKQNRLGKARLRRYHVVLATNPHCWHFHDGTWQRLQRGGVYTVDPAQEHASINLGHTVRSHLVVDVET